MNIPLQYHTTLDIRSIHKLALPASMNWEIKDAFRLLKRTTSYEEWLKEYEEKNQTTLEETGIEFTYSYGGRHEKDKWLYDLWNVTGIGDFYLEFKSGIGHSFESIIKTRQGPQVVAFAKPPCTMDILYCLRWDDPMGQTFETWCTFFDYNSDSIKDKAIYDACREQTDMYRRNYSLNLQTYLPLEDY